VIERAQDQPDQSGMSVAPSEYSVIESELDRTGDSSMTQERVQCCFCGEPARDTSEEPVEIAISFKTGSSQCLWSHIDCIGVRLHSSVPWLSLKDRKETRDQSALGVRNLTKRPEEP
jgi:hypothetical protein